MGEYGNCFLGVVDLYVGLGVGCGGFVWGGF